MGPVLPLMVKIWAFNILFCLLIVFTVYVLGRNLACVGFCCIPERLINSFRVVLWVLKPIAAVFAYSVLISGFLEALTKKLLLRLDVFN